MRHQLCSQGLLRLAGSGEGHAELEIWSKSQVTDWTDRNEFQSQINFVLYASNKVEKLLKHFDSDEVEHLAQCYFL